MVLGERAAFYNLELDGTSELIMDRRSLEATGEPVELDDCQ